MQSAVNRWVIGSNPILGVDKPWGDAILCVWDRRPTAESTDLKSVKYGFESHRSYLREWLELAYTADSKSAARKGVWVRIPPLALCKVLV